MEPQEDWLNGWPQLDEKTVLMGTGVHCIGCGRTLGVICVTFTDDWEPPGPTPEWPHKPADCPVCA